MHKDKIKFIMGTHTGMNDQHEYGYRYFGARTYKTWLPVLLICIVSFSTGTYSLILYTNWFINLFDGLNYVIGNSDVQKCICDAFR